MTTGGSGGIYPQKELTLLIQNLGSLFLIDLSSSESSSALLGEAFPMSTRLSMSTLDFLAVCYQHFNAEALGKLQAPAKCIMVLGYPSVSLLSRGIV